MRIVFTLLILLLSIASRSQDYSIKFFDSDESNQTDYAASIVETEDSNLMLCGWTRENVTDRGFFRKVDMEGNHLWGKICYIDDIRIKSIVETKDSGFVFCGEVFDASSFSNALIGKMDRDGNFVWVKGIGGSNDEGANAVIKTFDGGYAISGNTFSLGFGYNFYICKLDSMGNLEWAESIGSSGEDSYDLIQALDSGYVMAGSTNQIGLFTGGYTNMYLVKFDKIGELEWTKAFTDPTAEVRNESVNSIIVTDDGNYLIAGGISTRGFFLSKVSDSGSIIWKKLYSGYQSGYGEDVIQAKNGDFIVVGSIEEIGSSYSDPVMFCTDLNGNFKWGYKYQGTEKSEGANSVIQLKNGGFAIAGYQSEYGAATNGYSGMFIKTDSLGRTFNCDTPLNFTVTDPNLHITSGGSLDSGGVATDIVLTFQSFDFKDTTLCSYTVNTEEIPHDISNSSAQVFPNPTYNIININGMNVEGQKDITLKNTLGQMVHSAKTTEQNCALDLTDFAKGIYFLSVSINGKNHLSEKVVLMR